MVHILFVGVFLFVVYTQNYICRLIAYVFLIKKHFYAENSFVYLYSNKLQFKNKKYAVFSPCFQKIKKKKEWSTQFR